MKKNLLLLVVSTFIASMAIAAPTSNLAEQSPSKQNSLAGKPKKCPKGFVSMGVIVKIDRAASGMVTESVKVKGGTIQKMPPFKADKDYDSKVGDAYCVDSAADND